MNTLVVKLQPFILSTKIGVDNEGIAVAIPIGVALAYNSDDAFYRARLRFPQMEVLEPLPWAMVPPELRLSALEADRMIF
jgi:hypothetical protein